MSSLSEIVLAIAVAFGGMVALLLAYLGVRRLVTVVVMRRLAGRVRRIDDVLQGHQQEQFRSLDRLLFQLGEVNDLPAVEAGLNRVLPASGEERARLLQVYRSLGIVDRYRRDLRGATGRAVRASAAHALGDLQVIEAIPDLVASLRDPDEDAGTVKLAAAQALGRMQALEAIPLLLAELRTRDQWASPRIADLLVSFGERALPPLLQALADETNVNARVWAAQILGRAGNPAAEAPLLQRLRDRSEQVRLSAAEALGALGLRQSVGELMHVALHDPVAPVRAEAARALGRIGDESAMGALLALLADPDYWTRMRVIGAIELIRPPDTSALEALLHDPSPEVRNRAAAALDRIGVLARRVDEMVGGDRVKRDRATRFVLDVGRAGLLQSLMAFLDHADLRVRARMADILGRVGDPAAVPALTARLSDPEWPVRVRVLEALARLRPDDGPARVVRALSDPEDTVRAAAIQALKAFGLSDEDPHVQGVVDIFDGHNVEVRAGVVEAVGHLRHPAVDSLLERALQDPDPDVRLVALRAAGRRADEAWLPRVQEHLGDPDGRIRLVAIEALGRIGTPKAVEALLPHLDSPDRTVREVLTSELAEQGPTVTRWFRNASGKEALVAQAWLLGKVGDPAVLPELRALAASPWFEVRAATAGALGKVEDPGSRELLAGLLGDTNARVRAAAVNALGRIGTAETTAALEGALVDPDPFVRNRIAIALGRIGGPPAEAALERLASRDPDPGFQAFVAIGFGLTGGSTGFARAVEAMADPRRQPRVQAVLEAELPEVRDRFVQALNLAGAEGVGRFLSPGEVAAHCATVLRTHQSPEARVAAVASLRGLDPAVCRDLLVDVVGTDPAPAVRARALSTLAALLPDDDLAAVFARSLRDPVASVQIEAARGLARARPGRLNPDLLRALLSENVELEAAVVDTLACLNLGDLDAFVDDLMGFQEEAILRGGMQVLGRLGDARAARLLVAWLSAPRPEIRASAARALGQVAAPGVGEALGRCLGDPVEEVRVAVVEGLAGLGDPATLPALEAASRDPSRWVRRTLARALSTAGPDAETLRERLADDPDDEVRVEALLALMTGADVADGRTIARLESAPRTVRERLREAVEGHPVLGSLAKRLAGDRRPAARVGALRALGLMGRCTDRMLLAAFQDPAPEVRATAVRLAPATSPELRAGVRRLADDPDATVAAAARGWLGPGA